ncbi:MAG: SCO family protein [Sphingomonas sp. 32-62-10]|nr:MAG: SCO family protein [Sphingomonas sp. 12-62-6]OYX38741.1 MAG: SCO family protein [Sphingomonas sp. 32-62-10]
MACRAMNEKLKRAFALITAVVLAGCSVPGTSGQETATPPLAGARIGGPFTLTDQNGKIVRDTDFAGKYRIIYFGYSYCPDVCPIDVQNIALAMRALDKSDPALSARVVPIFITVDPARDTPAALKQFAGAFSPRLIALTGTQAQIDAVKKRFAIYSEAKPKRPDGGYIVDHSRLAYLFGPKGEPLALLPQDKSPDEIVNAIKRWAK